MTTLSPGRPRPSPSMVSSTTDTAPLASGATGETNVSIPQARASWLRTAGTGVNASTGVAERWLARRWAVRPVWVKTATARAPTTRLTADAAAAIASWDEPGSQISGGMLLSAWFSAVSTTRVMVDTAATLCRSEEHTSELQSRL